MHKLMKQKLVLFKKQKVEIIPNKIFRTFSMLYFFVGTNSSLSLREFYLKNIQFNQGISNDKFYKLKSKMGKIFF
jgi:hypothetical protein